MKLVYNSPVILSYTFLAGLILLLEKMFPSQVMRFFTLQPSLELDSISDYPMFFTYILGHGNWDHFIGNFMLILILGPFLEEKYTSKTLILMIVATALITGIVGKVFSSYNLLGASGVAFMLIILSSFTSVKKGIPVTFIIVCIFYIGRELINTREEDNVAQWAHIIGGIMGSIFGFLFQQNTKTPDSYLEHDTQE